jgi:hypothetical protein
MPKSIRGEWAPFIYLAAMHRPFGCVYTALRVNVLALFTSIDVLSTPPQNENDNATTTTRIGNGWTEYGYECREVPGTGEDDQGEDKGPTDSWGPYDGCCHLGHRYVSCFHFYSLTICFRYILAHLPINGQWQRCQPYTRPHRL